MCYTKCLSRSCCKSELKSYGGARLDERRRRKRKREKAKKKKKKKKKKNKKHWISKEVDTCNRLILFVNIKCARMKKREINIAINKCLEIGLTFIMIGFDWWISCKCSLGKVFRSLLLRGKYRCSNLSQSSNVFFRSSGDGFDCRAHDERYRSYKVASSESSILDAPLRENSGALDVVLVDIIGIVFDVGVFKCSDGRFSDDEQIVIDGCWIVTLTRGLADGFVVLILHLIR